MDYSEIVTAKETWAKKVSFKVFFALTVVLGLAEPFLVAFNPKGLDFQLQIWVLGGSTFLFFVYVICVALYVEMSNISFTEKLLSNFSNDTLFDFIGLLWGWVFIFQSPGIAALRVLRVFRLLWHYKIVSAPAEESAGSYVGFKQLCNSFQDYLEKISVEFFSSRSRGGIVVIFLYFFLTFLFAVVFWNEEKFLVTDEGKI